MNKYDLQSTENENNNNNNNNNNSNNKHFTDTSFISNSGQAARNPQSWLYFQDFQGSELLNGCLVV